MVGMFEMFHARLTGVAHCIVPQILPIPIDTQGTALLQQPNMEFLQNIMQPLLPDQMAIRAVPPSIVQIVVPMHSLPMALPIEKLNISSEEVTTTTQSTVIVENVTSEEFPTTTEAPHNEVSTQEPVQSSSQVIIITSSTMPFPEDDIDEMILNEDLDSEYHQGNEEVIKKQRDRSDFRYVESFEPEKSNVKHFEQEHSDNEGANVIHENFSQIPSVLPVPKALSSPKEVSSTELDEIPPDAMIQDDSETT